jgi:hypothetical protein
MKFKYDRMGNLAIGGGNNYTMDRDSGRRKLDNYNFQQMSGKFVCSRLRK